MMGSESDVFGCGYLYRGKGYSPWKRVDRSVSRATARTLIASRLGLAPPVSIRDI